MENLVEMSGPDWDEFVKERLDVLTALDIDKFRAYLAKYDEPVKEGMNDITLLAGMHYARINANFMPDAAKEVSMKWLRQNGFNLYPRQNEYNG